MRKLLFLVICFLLLPSCGEIGEEAKNLETAIFTSKVYNAGEEGIYVKSPASTSSLDTILLKNGYFEFWFTFKNKNTISIVITDMKLEVLKNNSVVNDEEYIPVKHVPDPVVGDPGRKFFAHLDPDATAVLSLGGLADGKFYMDDLERDLETGLFLSTIRITLNGFTTKTTKASGDDPFLNEEGFFQRIIMTSVR